MAHRNKSSAHTVREIACDAMVDPRSVKRVLNNEPVRDLTRLRIERAIHLKGLDHLLPVEDDEDGDDV